MAFEQKIVLEVNDQELIFNVNSAAYSKYQNSTTPFSKIQPATNFLMAVVDGKSKKALKHFLTQPGAALNLVAAIVEEYQPEFNITVKKSNSEQLKSEETE